MTIHSEPLHVGATPRDARILCVFVHGRTQSPEIMVDTIVSRLKTDGVAFVLPRAAGNSWYAARAVDPLTAETRAALSASLDYLDATIRSLRAAGGEDKALVLAGFSQGACLSLEYAMKHGAWNGALAGLTGCRVGTADDDRPFSDLGMMPAYLSGSDADPWIPVEAFSEAATCLGKARATLRAELFPGREHCASPPEIAAFDALLCDLADGTPPFERGAP